jgi:hypothetical protein
VRRQPGGHSEATDPAANGARSPTARRTNVGAALRRARRARGLELADVEHALRIREQHLRALETNRFDDIDGTAYARLFLREYADYLGLDGERVLTLVGDRLESHETLELEPEDATGTPTEIEPTRLLVWIDHALGHVPPGVRRWAWLAVVLVPILVLVLRAGGGSHHATLEPPTPTRTPTVASLPPDSRLIATPATLPAATRIPLSRRMSVELSAPRGDCWILVRDGSSQGPVMFEGVVRRGGTVGFQGKTLWLRVGAPWNLVVRVDGRVTRRMPTRPSDLLVTAQGARTAT